MANKFKYEIFKTIDTKQEDSNIEKENSLEQEIVKLIDKALKERLVELASDDIKIIAKELMPDLDKIVAKKVRKHFQQIGKFLLENNTGE